MYKEVILKMSLWSARKQKRNVVCLGGADDIKEVQQKMELLDLTGIILLSVSRYDSQK